MKTPADISLTARYTAAAWEALDLPHARRFSDRRGRLLYRASMTAGALLPGGMGRTLVDSALMPRHLFIDDWIRTHGVQQVVEVASGFSRRGVTFAGEGLRYVEVDRPVVMRQKVKLCEDLLPGERPVFLGLDATQPDFAQRVLAECDPALATVLITEGLSPYFDREGYLGVLGQLHPIAARLNATYLTDVYPDRSVRSRTGAWIKAGARAIAAIADRIYLYLRDEEDIEELFGEGGWEVTAVHRPAQDPAYTRGRRPALGNLMWMVEARPLAH